MDFFAKLFELLSYIWPCRRIEPWELGVYVEGGRAIRILPPGVWLFVPWFTEIHQVTTVPDIVITPLLDITLADGKMLTFQAEADYVVTDTMLAVTSVHDYHHRVQELLGGVLSETLGGKSKSDFDEGVRKGLVTMCVNRVNKQTEPFGIHLNSLWFTTFALDVRTMRFLGSSNPFQ